MRASNEMIQSRPCGMIIPDRVIKCRVKLMKSMTQLKGNVMRKIIIAIFCLLVTSNVFSQDQLNEEREIGKGSIITGTCLFLTPWLACLAVAAGDPNAAPLMVPVLGPYLADKSEMQSDNPSSGGFYVSLGICLAEAIGITLVTVGIIGKRVDSQQALIYPTIRKGELGLRVRANI
jgi:hypothetical protein